jgi:hypothetical protein
MHLFEGAGFMPKVVASFLRRALGNKAHDLRPDSKLCDRACQRHAEPTSVWCRKTETSPAFLLDWFRSVAARFACSPSSFGTEEDVATDRFRGVPLISVGRGRSFSISDRSRLRRCGCQSQYCRRSDASRDSIRPGSRRSGPYSSRSLYSGILHELRRRRAATVPA